VVDDRTDLSGGANDDVIATDVRRRGEKIPRIVNIYHQKDARSGERPAQKLDWQNVIRQCGTVLAGDLTAHSERWDPRWQVQRDATFWEGVIDDNGLEIGNDGTPTHHWTREDQESESVIELTLANRPIARWTILVDDHATGSNHEVIEWEVGVDRQQEADHERVVGWDLAAMRQEDAEAAEKLWMELAKDRIQLDAECTENEVEQEAAWCQEPLSSVLDATAKKIMICARSKRWWNADIKEGRRTVGRERRRKRHSEEAGRAKAALQKSIRQSNRRMWDDYQHNLRGAEMWMAVRYANPRAGTTVEALTDRDSKHASTSSKKEEMLRHESFPPNEGDQYYELPPAASCNGTQDKVLANGTDVSRAG